MKNDFSFKVEIPKDVEIHLDGRIKVKGKLGEVEENFRLGKLHLRKDENFVYIEAQKATKREKKLAGTVVGKLKNMIKGVSEGFTYKLQIASSHFPMRIEFDKKNQTVLVRNFLGERIARKAKILDNVNVEISGDMIKVFSANKETAGQSAANIEATTKINTRDRRIFQDGIYLVEKPK